MLLKFLVTLLIICEQLNINWGAEKLTQIVYRKDQKNNQGYFLFLDKKEINKPLVIDRKEADFIFPLSPLPTKKKDASSPPDLNCVSACVLDFNTAMILYEKNKDQKVPMASLAKIMTAIIILEDNKLDDLVTIKKESLGLTEEESKLGLVEGDQIKVKDLLYALLIHSANDSARVLADYKAGDEKKFIELMNKKAQNLGLKNTHFATVSGLDEKDNYSSAYDLSLLFKYACQNPLFLEIINTKEYSFVSIKGHNYSFSNTNELLGNDSRIIGGKTGFTEGAGRCLISLAQDKDHKVITVLMNCPERFEDTKKILDWTYSNYLW